MAFLARLGLGVALALSTSLGAARARAADVERSARRAAAADQEEPPRIALLTMSPGDDAFAHFGHNALLLEWSDPPRALVFNYGTFAFDGLDGVQDFMAGRLRYWLSVGTLDATLDFYAAHQRSVIALDLDLTRGERARLTEALFVNARPQNRHYDYDYYFDNCSTRVRDVLDRTLGGALSRGVTGPGRLSFRAHTLRLTADDFWLSFGLDLALGPLTDRPTTRWQELFLPGELHASLRALRRAREGAERPLALGERTLHRADRAAPPADPPGRVPAFALVGLVLGGGFAGLGALGRTKRWARRSLASASALVGFVLGLLGTVFAVFWAFTTHWSAHRNENLLVCPPWALALVVTAVGLARGRDSARQRSERLLAACAIAAGVAVLLALIPRFGQDNTRFAALLAPVWVGLYVGVRGLR